MFAFRGSPRQLPQPVKSSPRIGAWLSLTNIQRFEMRHRPLEAPVGFRHRDLLISTNSIKVCNQALADHACSSFMASLR